jgi:hypothetical protein
MVFRFHVEGGSNCGHWNVQEKKIPKNENLSEEDKRRQRRQVEAERRRMLEQRERKGLKPWFLDVTRGGVPFGAGVQAWRREIKKTSEGALRSLLHQCTNARHIGYGNAEESNAPQLRV